MKFWIWYTLLESLSLSQKRKLLGIYGNPKKIFEARRGEFENLKFLKESNIDEMLQKRNMSLIAKYEEYMKKNNIKMINITDSEYPEKLRNIYNPPISLFIKGDSNLLKEYSIGIIGCREASKYGLNVAKKMAYDLASENIVIVSGMAKGIDGMAHRGALTAKGKAKTIAVLGSGVDYPYPKENFEIYKEIIKNGGLIISEFIVGTEPNAKNFPKRNRIISGLSEGILVIEAKKKSGTMITVDFALEQGKNVYIVPGNIDSVNSEGTNELIKQGAKLVSNISDILEDF